jgi:hypothetical protein
MKMTGVGVPPRVAYHFRDHMQFGVGTEHAAIGVGLAPAAIMDLYALLDLRS